MSKEQLQLALWVSQPILQAMIAVVVYRRRLHKDFPAFFSFTVAQIVIFIVEYPVYNWADPETYFYVFWISAALNVVFAFQIIHEVFLDAFKPYPALKDLGSALFKWAALIMILVSVVLISVSPGWDNPVRESILVVQRCVRVVQCGLVLFLLAFSKNLGVSWRRQSFGIALGFGLFSGVELLTYALYSGSHLHGMLTNLVNMTAYNAGMVLWLSYSVLNRKGAVVPILVPQRWDEALTDLRPQSEAESLIPMFEHMVDQAFSKVQDSRA
jgi:hypothetical protein